MDFDTFFQEYKRGNRPRLSDEKIQGMFERYADLMMKLTPETVRNKIESEESVMEWTEADKQKAIYAMNHHGKPPEKEKTKPTPKTNKPKTEYEKLMEKPYPEIVAFKEERPEEYRKIKQDHENFQRWGKYFE